LRLDRAVFRLVNVIDGSGAAGELTQARGGRTLPPRALTARPGSHPGEATFETPAGARPSVKVEIEVDRNHSDRMAFDLTVKHVALAAPVRCSGKKGSQTQLETSFVLQTGSRPDVLVGAFLPWECHGQELRR
jgi:hypothetical protein